eukprot:3618821-Alexandrium_andersonii.AAC.1
MNIVCPPSHPGVRTCRGHVSGRKGRTQMHLHQRPVASTSKFCVCTLRCPSCITGSRFMMGQPRAS